MALSHLRTNPPPARFSFNTKDAKKTKNTNEEKKKLKIVKNDATEPPLVILLRFIQRIYP